MPHASRRGAVLPLVALFLPILMVLLAFSIDLGYIQIARAQLQTAADAGALAGARGLTNCCPSKALSEAQRVAQLNSVFQTAVSVTSSEDIVLGTWDDTSSSFSALTGDAQSNANAVQVTCRRTAARRNALTLFFARVFGVDSQNVIATAIAKSSHVQCGPFVGLNFVTISGASNIDSYSSASGAYSALSAGQKGTVCSNGTISISGGATVNGDAHAGEDSNLDARDGADVTGSDSQLTNPLTEPAVDPGNAAMINDNGSIPLTAQNKDPLSNGHFTLSGSDSVTLAPGTYYFATLMLSGATSVTTTGKTVIYVTGKVDTSGGALINTTQIPSNLQLYPMGTTCVLSGTTPMYAVIYGPTADITRSGDSDFFGTMVGKSLNLSGEGDLHADLSVFGVSGSTKKATLVQ